MDLFRQTADLPDVAQLATKDDVALSKADLRAEIAQVRADLGAEIGQVKVDLHTGIADLKTGIEVRIATLDAKVGMLMWMVGILGGGTLVLQVLTATVKVLHLG